ncbi:hypothetical protein D3C73_1490730 [compost metagenome]
MKKAIETGAQLHVAGIPSACTAKGKGIPLVQLLQKVGVDNMGGCRIHRQRPSFTVKKENSLRAVLKQLQHQRI